VLHSIEAVRKARCCLLAHLVSGKNAHTAPTQPKCDEYLWNFTPPTMQKHTRRPPLRKIMFISFKSVWAKGQRCPKIHASH
jgi:hypothetical protein